MRHLILLLSCLVYGAVTSGQSNSRANKDYALFFAVNDYASMTDLTNPIKNAKEIAKELKEKYGFETEVVENPTLDKIEAKLAEYARKFSSGTFDQNGQLLLFFTGHGMTSGPNGYFMPADADEDRAYRTGFEYDHWRAQINNIACKHILVTIDACYSISFDEQWEAKPDRVFGPPGSKEKDQVLLDHQTYRTRRYFTSDAEESQTPDRSTLAYQFLTALRTHQTYTGYLTADELFSNYLRKASPTPGSGKFGDNEPAARFLFFNDFNSIEDELTDLEDWEAAVQKNDCEGYRDYLKKHRDGNFLNTVLEKIADCEETEMLRAWKIAKYLDTGKKYDDFNLLYSDNPFFQEAEKRRDKYLERKKKEYEELVVKNSKIDNMMIVPEGIFKMGDTFSEDKKAVKKLPKVYVEQFQIGAYEVTAAEFEYFLQSTGLERKIGSRNTGGNAPATYLDWRHAVSYCNWLSLQRGYEPVYTIVDSMSQAIWEEHNYGWDLEKLNSFIQINAEANGYRLPTSAEWEYAASYTDGTRKSRFGNGQDTAKVTEIHFNGLEEHKQSYSEGYRIPSYNAQAVGHQRSPNSLGLHDMSGNISELCWPWKGGKPIPTIALNAGCPSRGGNFNVGPYYSQISIRRDDVRGYTRGFRIARNY